MQTKQKQSNRNKTFCVILIWSIANIKLLSALQTPYCNHHRFESRLMKTLSCLENANREIGLGSERNIGCDDIDKVHSCTIDNIGTCFNEDIKNDLATILEMAKMEIAGNGSLIKKHLNPMSDINLTCERFTGPDKARVMNNAMALVQKYSQNLRNPKFLDSIITLDNKCSFEDLIDSFGELPQSPCVERNLMDVLLIFKEVTEIKNLGLNQRSNNFGNLQSPSSLCKEINEILNCVKPNECFSAQEVQLVKKLVLTMYKMLLKSVIKITDKSGGIDKVIDSLSMNPDIKTLYQQAGIDGNILKRMYELVLNDFEVICFLSSCLICT